MGVPSSLRLPALVACYIFLNCLIQSNYAEVCYLRIHIGYGGCFRWFLPVEEVPTCTSLKLGGYTTEFYKRSHIIVFHQPFVSGNADEVRDFLTKGVHSPAISHAMAIGIDKEFVTMREHKFSAPATKSSYIPKNSQDSSDQATVSFDAETTRSLPKPSSDLTFTTASKNHLHVSSKSSDSPNQSGGLDVTETTTSFTQVSTYQTFTTAFAVCPNLTCYGTTISRELELQVSDGSIIDCSSKSSEETKCRCNPRQIVTCSCVSGTNVFPIGVTSNGSEMCRCHRNGSLVCYDDTHVGNTVCDHFDDEMTWFFATASSWKIMTNRSSDCQDLYDAGVRKSGAYCVYSTNRNISSRMVYCDVKSSPSGGWTVIQRRVNGSVDFYRNWTEYKDGFGNLDHEFWFGNDIIYQLTNQRDMKFRVDIENDSRKFYAVYNLFRIGNETAGYKLIELGNFAPSGIDYDALRLHVGVSFSTDDRDMDLARGENCAETNHGGWWFTDCHTCYLNGVYGESTVPGIRWYRLPGGHYNIKRTEMKIKPVSP